MLNIESFCFIYVTNYRAEKAKEKFQLMAIIDAIPTCITIKIILWFPISAPLHFNGHNILHNKALSKNIYKEVHSKIEIITTAQLKYSEKYNYQLDWKEV